MGTLFLYKKFFNLIYGIIAFFNLIEQKAMLTDLGFSDQYGINE